MDRGSTSGTGFELLRVRWTENWGRKVESGTAVIILLDDPQPVGAYLKPSTGGSIQQANEIPFFDQTSRWLV
jgi:hypothetical protein